MSALADAYLAGGARFIQIRSKHAASAAFLGMCEDVVARARKAGATVIVNDRADIAKLSAADGVHVGQDDLDPASARRILGGAAIVGVSTHSADQVRAAAGMAVDYIAVGPIFGTSTKDTGYRGVGTAFVSEAVGHPSARRLRDADRGDRRNDTRAGARGDAGGRGIGGRHFRSAVDGRSGGERPGVSSRALMKSQMSPTLVLLAVVLAGGTAGYVAIEGMERLGRVLHDGDDGGHGRLSRSPSTWIHPQKRDTFVLDFRNELDGIQDAFRPYYERTEAVPTDPNLLYDTHRAVWDFGVIREEEVEAGVQALLAVTETNGHGAVYAALDPARDRFRELDEEVQDAFRDVLTRFVNMYAFVSQIVSYVDRELERDYLFGRALLAYLPGQSAERLDLGSEVEMTHLKIAQTFEGSGSLEEGGGDVVAIFSGRGKEHELEKEQLSQIVEVINERFGLDLGEADQLLFDQFEETWATDETLAARARTNTFENFRLVFDRTFIETVVKRMDQNADIFKRILDEPEFQRTVLDYYAARLYERLRAEHDQLGLSTT